MIQAVSDTCSVRWTKVNHQVYKFQSLVFSEDEKKIQDIQPPSTLSLIQPTLTNGTRDEEKLLTQTTHNKSFSDEDSACYAHSKITGPTQWKQVYGEYLGKESDVSQTQESPNICRKTFESPTKIVRQSPESPSVRQRKNIEELQFNKETCLKKDQRRVHFEDDVNFDDEDDEVFESEWTKKNYIPDCTLCGSIVQRDSSPPYQALVEKSTLQPPN